MEDLRLGVIGVGRMGANHCRVINSIRSSLLVGVYDLAEERAAEVANKYGTKAYPDLGSLLRDVDAVCISTPTQSHMQIVEVCIQHGVHMLVEKPLADTPQNAQQLVDSLKREKLIVQVGHIERFNPAYRELRSLLQDTPILTMDFRRLSPFPGSNTDVDVIYDLMVHDIDLMFDLLGEAPKSLMASGLTAFSDQIDHTSVIVEYPGGPLVTLTASRLTEEKIRMIEVATPNAFIEADLLDKKVSVNRRTIGEYINFNKQGVKYRHESLVERILVPSVEPLLMQWQHFVDSVRGKVEPEVSVIDGWRAIDYADRIQAQMHDRVLDAGSLKHASIANLTQRLPQT